MVTGFPSFDHVRQRYRNERDKKQKNSFSHDILNFFVQMIDCFIDLLLYVHGEQLRDCHCCFTSMVNSSGIVIVALHPW